MSKLPTVNGKPYKLKPGEYFAVDSDAFNKDPDGSEFRKIANESMVRELKRRQRPGYRVPEPGPGGKSDLLRNIEKFDKAAARELQRQKKRPKSGR